MVRDIFSTYHPAINFIFFGAVIVFGVIFLHPLMLAAAFAGAMSYAIYLLGRKAAGLFFKWLLPLTVIVTVINALFNHYGSTFIGYIGYNPITLESIIYGVMTGFMFSAIILWCRCYSEIMTTDKFMYIFGKLAPHVSLVFSMALRFIPKFREHLAKVREAASGIPQAGGKPGFSVRVKKGARTFSIMMTWALENAVDTADSMRSRGYGLRGRTAYSNYRWDGRDIAALVLLLTATAAVIAGGALGYCTFTYYPEISYAAVSARTLPVYIIYGLMCFMPVILNGREAVRWKRLRSEI